MPLIDLREIPNPEDIDSCGENRHWSEDPFIQGKNPKFVTYDEVHEEFRRDANGNIIITQEMKVTKCPTVIAQSSEMPKSVIKLIKETLK